MRKIISLAVMKFATWIASFLTIIIYIELLNPVYKLSEGALAGVAEAIRLAAKLLGLWEVTEKVLFL
ncbi:hypothetical protein [Sporosarcina sp. FSL K6-1508]|uniref:hypothetical protein n=1 Tax=Sporosarcina sp. FSL K6-1508 TaxID=2921553 RepID=UPI0030FA7E55